MRIKEVMGTVLGAAAMTVSGPALATSDAELSKALLGSWIVPMDSSDANAENTKTLETFSANGVYVWNKYADQICGKVAKSVRVVWVVRAGVLWQRNELGRVMRDRIVNVDSQSLTLHSLDDGTTFTRMKAPSCAARSTRPLS